MINTIVVAPVYLQVRYQISHLYMTFATSPMV